MLHAAKMSIDHELLQTRRRQVVAAMAGLPGQVRKSEAANDFDACIHASSGRHQGLEAARPDDILLLV